MVRRLGIFLLLLLVTGLSAQDVAVSGRTDAQEIIKKSLSHWRRNLDAAHNYTFQERSVEEEMSKDGISKNTKIETHEISIIYGDPYEKLIAKNDQPLNEKDRQKEEDKLNKYFEKQKNKSDEDREKERAKERDKFQREIADELPKMQHFEVAGEAEYQGRQVWVISATPNRDYKSNSMAGKLLSRVSGRIWITKDDYQWVKTEADLSDDFTIGLFLFKLHKGTHLEFEQTRVNDEVWLPKKVFVEGSGRIAIKTARFRNTTEYSNYQKFGAESKITGMTEELPPPEPAHPNQ